MAVLFKHACLSLGLCGGTCYVEIGNTTALLWGRYEPNITHHSGPPTTRSPTLTSPSASMSAVQHTEGSGPAVAQQDWEAGAGGRRQQLGVEGGVTPALGGGPPPAVPIWGEKRPRGSSISSRDGPGPEWLMAAAEQKHTRPLFQHQQPSTLNYFSGKEVYGQWTQPLEHWFILYTSFYLFSVK